MSWASRRRATYALGVLLILAGFASIPLVKYFSRPATCFDGSRNQGETKPDKGGPCNVLDEDALTPSTVLWARAFQVRDGSFGAVAYIENTNAFAGVKKAEYHMRLYDSKNILVAERRGTTAIMPGATTAIFGGGISTGNREVSRTFVELAPDLVWEKLENPATVLRIQNRLISNENVLPRLEATVENTSTRALADISFVAVIFTPAGNARAASKTSLDRVGPNNSAQIVFTWPEPFFFDIGRIDILPVIEPVSPARR